MDTTELLNIHNAFYQGQYPEVVGFDISSLSAQNQTTARVLQLRAQIALGQTQAVLKSTTEGDAIDFLAVKAFAQYYAGKASDALMQFEKLAETQSDNATVQLLGGIVLQGADRADEALSLLGKHQGNLEAYVHQLESEASIMVLK